MGARYQDFEGDWTLERVVTDAAGRHTMTGTARLAEGIFREEGGWTSGPYSGLRAERSYLWQPGIEVLFDDGRFFHHFDPALPDQEVAHWCEPDQYDGRYLLDLPDRWEVHWSVKGPRKNYVSVTRYLRFAGASGT